jgi:hypothetical protein
MYTASTPAAMMLKNLELGLIFSSLPFKPVRLLLF